MGSCERPLGLTCERGKRKRKQESVVNFMLSVSVESETQLKRNEKPQTGRKSCFSEVKEFVNLNPLSMRFQQAEDFLFLIS